MNKIISGIIFASCSIIVAPMAFACEPMHKGKPCNTSSNMHKGEPCDTSSKKMGMDSNQDGVISKQEFDSFHNSYFKKLDINNDGQLSSEEMQASHSKMHGRGDMHISDRFEKSDTNHDGALSREEAKDMTMLSQYFDKIDANKDGKVTQKELNTMMGKGSHKGMHGDM